MTSRQHSAGVPAGDRADLSTGLVIDHVTFHFATPVLSSVFDDFERLNPSLLEVVRDFAAREGFVSGSAEAGGSTPHDLHRLPSPAITELTDFIRSALDHLMRVEKVSIQGLAALDGRDWYDDVHITEMWASFVTSGNHVYPHAHGGSLWSGIYYLDAGGDVAEVGGRLCFLSPVPGAFRTNSNATAYARSAVHYEPQPGALFVFPGYLQHFVDVYRGSRPRVAIAFNADIPAGALDANRGNEALTREQLGL